MQQHIQDQNLKKTIEKLKPYGFEFHGYDEAGMPLVIAPNGQVVEINVAIKFANDQIAQQQNQASNGPEAPPEMHQMPQNGPENNFEASLEQESNIDNKREQADDQNQTQVQPSNDFVIKQQSPEVSLKKPEYIKPFGDGFEIKSFNPGSHKDASKYIEKNIKKGNKTSDKWLAVLFKKFIEENKLKSE